MNTNLKNIILWIIKIGLFAVPFIPLYLAGNLFFPFITGKAFAFRIIVELVFSLWLVLALFYKEYRPRKNWLLWAMGIFIFVVFLATIFGINPLRSFWSNYERMEGFLMYAHLFAYFLVLGNVFRKQDWFVLFNLFVVSGILENIYAVFQKLGVLSSIQGGFRVDGTIGNPSYLAAYLIFIVGFCAWLFTEAKNIYAKIYYAAAGFFTLAIIYLTASRGPVLGLLAGLFLALLVYLVVNKAQSEKEKRIKKIVLGSFIGLALLVLAIWMMRDVSFIKTSPVLSRLTSLSFSDRTITARFSVWKMSFEAFKERPVLGWGPENYVLVFSKYYEPGMWRQEPWFDRSHNIIFDWLINAGVLGLLAYLSIFVAAFYLLYKNYRLNKFSLGQSLLLGGLFTAYFFQNLFIFDNIATYISYFSFLALIYGVSTEESRGAYLQQQSVFPAEYIPTALLCVTIPFVFVCYFLDVKPLIANGYLLQGLKSAVTTTKEEAYDFLNKSLAIDSFLGRNERRSQFTNFVMDNVAALKFSDDQKKNILEKNFTELQSDIAENPTDPRPIMYLGMLYNAIGQFDKAIETYNGALALSPKKQDILFVISNAYINKEDYEGALLVLKKAFDNDPSFNTARINLAGAYILVGNQAEADRLLMEGFGTVNQGDEFLVKVYYKMGKLDRLIGLWQAFVDGAPNNIGYRKSLAGAYLLAGQKEAAISELQNIVKIDASFASEVENYISQIRSGELK